MLFTNKKVDRTKTIRANNKMIEQNKKYKFLGVIVDDGITWKSHLKFTFVTANIIPKIYLKL